MSTATVTTIIWIIALILWYKTGKRQGFNNGYRQGMAEGQAIVLTSLQKAYDKATKEKEGTSV